MVSVIKGLENQTFMRPSEIIEDVLGNRPVVALGGPSHAEEISRRLPASVVAASGDVALAKTVQEMFTTDRFRVYTNQDIVGVELAGALKNIIAIAAGISDGLKYGDNAKSALVTRGLVEITRFGESLGAEPLTFSGLAGMGDLITTCTSRYSRNRMVGERLGQGEIAQRHSQFDARRRRGRDHHQQRLRTGRENGHRHAHHPRSVPRALRGKIPRRSHRHLDAPPAPR